MLSLDHNHTVFKDFKHIKLQVDTTLVFQAGTGGNFLTGLMGTDWYSKDHTLNQYNADCLWLHLDNQNVTIQDEKIEYNRNPDTLYETAKHVCENEGQFKLAIGHELPYMTSKIFDYQTRELIVIESSVADGEIVEALRWYKHNFSTDYLHTTYMIPQIINQNRYTGKVNFAEYDKMLQVIKQYTSLDIVGTMFSWQYFLNCKADDIDPTDMQVLAAYLNLNWLKPVGRIIYSSQYHQQSRDWCKQHVELYTEVDYRDLFFRLQRPKQGALQKIDLSAVIEYSNRNIELLQQVKNLAPEVHKSRIIADIASLTNDLQIAQDTIGI